MTWFTADTIAAIAFSDSSRNRSGRWCSMASCGNIVKMRRAYRARTGASPHNATNAGEMP
jgi:predicted RNA-binding Zn ribbon-like protein